MKKPKEPKEVGEFTVFFKTDKEDISRLRGRASSGTCIM